MKNRTEGMTKSAAGVLCLLATLMLAWQAQAAKQPPQAPLDINRASAAELMTIPGLGASKAQAIVAHRAAAPFRTTGDLVAVKGIGDKLLAKIAPYVTVSGSAASDAPRSGTAEKSAR